LTAAVRSARLFDWGFIWYWVYLQSTRQHVDTIRRHGYKKFSNG
jgi:hypothetical protein